LLRQGVPGPLPLWPPPPPPGTAVLGGTEEPSSATHVDPHLFRRNKESTEGAQRQATGYSRPQRFTTPITYLHDQQYYTNPKPPSVCFQRQYQGELCPSSHACSNSTHNTNNMVTESEEPTGTGLIAARDILPNESLRSSDRQSFCKTGDWFKNSQISLTHNVNRPNRFQYSIFYPVAGDSYPSVVIPDHNRALALTIPKISKQLRAHLQHGSDTAGLAPLANHTCCLYHRNSVLQILSVWQEDRTRSTLLDPGDGE